MSAPARTWLVTDEHAVGAESVPAGQNSGGRTIHPPSAQEFAWGSFQSADASRIAVSQLSVGHRAAAVAVAA